MALVQKGKSTGEFTFIWSIHNFSHFRNSLLKKNSSLESPRFTCNFLKGEYNLKLYASKNNATDFLNCGLEFYNSNYNSFSYALSVCNSNGLFKVLPEKNHEAPFVIVVERKICQSDCYSNFLGYHELKGPNGYLDNDILTLRFLIRKNITGGSSFIKCYALTKVKVSKLDYVWVLEDVVDSTNALEYKFNHRTQISGEYSGFGYLYFSLLNSDKSDTIYFSVTARINNKDLFMVYNIHLLDANGSVSHSVGGENLFDISSGGYKEMTCNFPLLSKLRLLSQKKLYLPNDALTLRCEFSFSSNEVYSEFEKYEHGKLTTDNLKLRPKLIPDGHDLWKENMRRFYTEGKFSDLIIRTYELDIPVHRAILCAQSTVFSSMFEHKMKESISGVVEIKDLETDTVSKMLEFLYTNTLGTLDYSAARKMYFAADRYRIIALRIICSNFLISCLDTSNVCDVLALADNHKDEELKSRARGFVMEHAYEIVHSESWKKLMQTHSYVTSELMQQMISKNFLGFLKA